MTELFRLLRDPVFLSFALVMFVVFMRSVTYVHRAQQSGTRGKMSRDARDPGQEETREMQELYRGFEDLSKRVEALETILLDEARRKQQ